MRLSIPKINQIAHRIADEISDHPKFDCMHSMNDIRLRIKIIITDELKLENDIDRTVRRMLNSLTKAPPEGSKEWEVLYEKYFEEEMNRRQAHKADGIRRMI